MADDPPDTRVPTLAVPLREANPVIGQGNYIGMERPTGGDPPKDDYRPLPPIEQDFAVSTAGIRDAEQKLISSGLWQVDEFETFKKRVLDEEKWVFLVSDPHDIEVYYHDPKDNRGIPLIGTTCAAMGTCTPTSRTRTRRRPRTPSTVSTLCCARSVTRLRASEHFTAMLNNAAQLYALADENSTPPQDSTV